MADRFATNHSRYTEQDHYHNGNYIAFDLQPPIWGFGQSCRPTIFHGVTPQSAEPMYSSMRSVFRTYSFRLSATVWLKSEWGVAFDSKPMGSSYVPTTIIIIIITTSFIGLSLAVFKLFLAIPPPARGRTTGIR